MTRAVGLFACFCLFVGANGLAQGTAFTLVDLEVGVEAELTAFRLEIDTDELEPNLGTARLRLVSSSPAVPPPLVLVWSMPAEDVHGHWTTSSRFEKALDPDWDMSSVESMLARNAPVMSLFGSDDGNRLTFAVSDALNTVSLKAGVREEDATVRGRIELFSEPHPAVTELTVTLRFDRRDVGFQAALRDVSDWWAGLEGFEPAAVPSIARAPMYSTWYSYHQSVEAAALLREVEIAGELGYEAIIVDDGWQTLDDQRGYAFTGDWKPERIPEMKRFVDDVHARGSKVLLWYAMSLVGERSDAYPRFAGKYLRHWEGQSAYVLDPRYPEVREYIIGTYRDAIERWGVDGFKLDFLGFFVANEETVLEAGGGRDYASVNRATDRLMTDVMKELRAVKPDVMIEFRQPYVGPLMRKYGNMFRAGDAPNAAVDNRVRTVDLRLLSGDTAVHSDMFMWHVDAPVEAAALQFLNILFSVPQLSVRLEAVPPEHREMIRFYTEYWRANRDVLLDGAFEAKDPMANYPLVSAHNDRKRIVAAYGDIVVRLPSRDGTSVIDVVNAKTSARVVLDALVPLGSYRVEAVDARGREVGSAGSVTLGPGTLALEVPPSGMVRLTRVAEPESSR